jgi:hypothetical protein
VRSPRLSFGCVRRPLVRKFLPGRRPHMTPTGHAKFRNFAAQIDHCVVRPAGSLPALEFAALHESLSHRRLRHNTEGQNNFREAGSNPAFGLNASQPPKQNCADDNNKQNSQLHGSCSLGYRLKSPLLTIGHSPCFVLRFAFRSANSHCWLV